MTHHYSTDSQQSGLKQRLSSLARNKNRQLWWKILAVSTLIQLGLVWFIWHKIEEQRFTQPIQIDPQTTVSAELIETVDTPASAEAMNSNGSLMDKPVLHKAPSSQNAPVRKPTDPKGTQPLGSQLNQKADENAKETLAPSANQSNTPATTKPTSKPDQKAGKTTENTASPSVVSVASTPNTSNNSNLTSVPIALHTIHYRVELNDGTEITQLSPAQLNVRSLGDNRYSVSLANGTTQGSGNFGWHYSFLNTDRGPQPLEVGGGLYIKRPDKLLRLALGLNLHDDGQTWHWGKKSNISIRTHIHFLDRVGLVTYIQGMLQRKPIKGNTRWVLPVAGGHAVRDIAIQLSVGTKPPANTNCQPCVQGQAAGDLGEMQHWSVWYDGGRNWRPVAMQMRLNRATAWTLTLTEQ